MKWLVFSKNRAYQLDAFIRSASKNAGISKSDLTILYKYDPEYLESLKALMNENPECTFIEEVDFKSQTIEWVKNSGFFVSFATDDAIFTRFADVNKACEVLRQNSQIFTFSLRLGLHLDFCYPISQKQQVPNGQIISEIFLWNSNNANGDWNYPLSVDGHIFRSNEILEILEEVDFKNPNTLEANIQAFRHAINPFASCFMKSCYMNIPLNVVQKIYNNKSGNVTAQILELKYKCGERFDEKSVENFLNVSAHQELEI